MTESLLRTIARHAHTVWSDWIHHLFSKCVLQEDGSMVIPRELVDRWYKQADLSFDRLPQEDQVSDYRIAKQYIALFGNSIKKMGDN